MHYVEIHNGIELNNSSASCGTVALMFFFFLGDNRATDFTRF